MQCPKCAHENNKLEKECIQCGIVFSKYIDPKEKKRAYEDKVEKAYLSLEKKSQLILEERWKLLFPLLAFVSIPISKFLILPAMIFDAMRIWAHEFGHAVAAWLGGRAAIPVILWTNIANERSWSVFICLLSLILIVLYYAYRDKSYFIISFCILTICTQFYLFFLTSERELDLFFTHSGVGGEFYISTFAIIAFHYRLPKGSFWPFLRYWILLASVYVFFKSFYFWQQVDSGMQSIPWGSAVHGQSDQGGDMNRLHNIWGWTPKEIIQSYVTIAYSCMCIIVVHYMSVVAVIMISKRYTIVKQYNKIFRRYV